MLLLVVGLLSFLFFFRSPPPGFFSWVSPRDIPLSADFQIQFLWINWAHSAVCRARCSNRGYNVKLKSYISAIYPGLSNLKYCPRCAGGRRCQESTKRNTDARRCLRFYSEMRPLPESLSTSKDSRCSEVRSTPPNFRAVPGARDDGGGEGGAEGEREGRG